MQNAYINIYHNARQVKGLTQEKAAELIGVSVESIRAYEAGRTTPPDEVAIRMIEVYDVSFLAIQHLRAKSELARSVIPDIELKDIPEAILRIHKELTDIMKCRDDLIEIGSDGIISEDERPRWEAIMKELDDVIKAGLALKFVGSKKA